MPGRGRRRTVSEGQRGRALKSGALFFRLPVSNRPSGGWPVNDFEFKRRPIGHDRSPIQKLCRSQTLRMGKRGGEAAEARIPRGKASGKEDRCEENRENSYHQWFPDGAD